MARGRKIQGNCLLCQEYGPLSKEHYPPRAAFNSDTMIIVRPTNAWKDVTKSQQQGGHGKPAFCPKCNNNLGSWYASAYVEFAGQVADALLSSEPTRWCSTELRAIYPLRVLKHVLSMFFVASGGSMLEAYPGIRRFLQERTRSRFSLRTSIRGYGISRRVGRVAEVTFARDITAGRHAHIGELAMWPLGWRLSTGPNQLPAWFEINHWSAYAIDDKASFLLTLPVLTPSSLVPLTFAQADYVPSPCHSIGSL